MGQKWYLPQAPQSVILVGKNTLKCNLLAFFVKKKKQISMQWCDNVWSAQWSTTIVQNWNKRLVWCWKGAIVQWYTGVMICSLMVYKRVKQRKDCDYGQQLRYNMTIHPIYKAMLTNWYVIYVIEVSVLWLHQFDFGINQHQSISISSHHQSAPISTDQHQSTLISINQHQSASIRKSISKSISNQHINQHINQHQSTSVSINQNQ